jgi:hypothetical protein
MALHPRQIVRRRLNASVVPPDETIDRWHRPFNVMARLVRATCRSIVLVQVARTSRAMTFVAIVTDI